MTPEQILTCVQQFCGNRSLGGDCTIAAMEWPQRRTRGARSISSECFGQTSRTECKSIPINPTWKSPPFTTLFCHVQNRVQHLKVGQTYVPALCRQTVFDAAILL
jgi:hypothetical protein